MRTEILSSISEINSDEWNSIVGRDRLICRHEYLLAIEKSKINDCRYFYPVIRDESGKLLAHTCLYFISTELDLFATGALKWGIQKIRKLWPRFLIMRSLECGTPAALGNTISYADAECAESLGKIVRMAEKLAVDIGVKVLLFRDFYDHDLGFYDEFRNLGYKRIHNLPSVHLNVEWACFDEYLNALRSSYRHKILSRIRTFKKSGASIELVESFSSLSGELAPLWKAVFDAALEYKREYFGPHFFCSIDRFLGKRSSVLVVKKERKIVGFMLLLFDDETLIPLSCGLDYSVSRDLCTYFNLFYRAIDVAIARRMKSVDLGITTIEPKTEFGGVVRTQYMYMKHTTRLLHQVVPHVFDSMTPQPKYRSRNVFKASRGCVKKKGEI